MCLCLVRSRLLCPWHQSIVIFGSPHVKRIQSVIVPISSSELYRVNFVQLPQPQLSCLCIIQFIVETRGLLWKVGVVHEVGLMSIYVRL